MSIIDNIYVRGSIIKARFLFDNSLEKNALRLLRSIDPVFDFEEFQKSVAHVKKKYKKGHMIARTVFGSESIMYGHLKVLADYCNRSYSEELCYLLPEIEHGVNFSGLIPESIRKPHVHLRVTQGDYRKAIIQQKRKMFPQFSVGPYIHYADTSISAAALESLKKTLGATLLLFPSHTFEFSEENESAIDFYRQLIREARSSFDSVLASIYWHDIDSELVGYLKSEGIVLVSAGMRSDVRFLNNLKTIIKLSDAIISIGLGTNIGYGYVLDKPLVIKRGCENGSTIGNAERDELAVNMRDFSNAFACFDRDDESVRLQTKLFDKFWGGIDAIKTRNEMNEIFTIAEDMLSITKGNSGKFESAYASLLVDYSNSTDARDLSKAKLLENALSISH